jgi:catechol 2,3-dioxygenase-like lactoylglutathione lyase family enzyme
MTREMLGIHHITAIAGDPQQNIEFYTGLPR